MKIHTLDLHFQVEGTIAAYLIETPGELALIETGPDSTYPNLVRALGARGLRPSDIATVLVTHIHLDHAGAAWQLAREGATVHVHPAGAAHLADPSKLLASARRIYREQMDSLWGTLEPIPAERLRTTHDGQELRVGDTTIRVLDTPGHASHHNTYLVEDLAVTGDVGGVSLFGGPVLPPTPPPDIDLEAWKHSLARLRDARPAALYPTHFGRVDDVGGTLDRLERELSEWSGWIKGRLDEGKDEPAIVPEFDAWLGARLAGAGATDAIIHAYKVALPFAMNVTGLARYWRKREQAPPA